MKGKPHGSWNDEVIINSLPLKNKIKKQTTNWVNIMFK